MFTTISFFACEETKNIPLSTIYRRCTDAMISFEALLNVYKKTPNKNTTGLFRVEAVGGILMTILVFYHY